jgi:2-dehydro-3-deoxyglucarate aldolase/4-hydroxy-2-oxoheptanedioate aldolase
MGLEAAARRRAQGYRMVVTANDNEMAARGFGEATTAFAALKAQRAAAPNGAAGEPGSYLSDTTPTDRRPEAAS